MPRTLPARLHFKHGRYYYVHRNKWTPLSKDFHVALTEYAKLMAPLQGGMVDLISKWLTVIQPSVATSTYKTYVVAAEKLKTALVEFGPCDVKPKHVASLLEHHKSTPAMANTMRNVLKQVFARAVIAGDCDINPVQFVAPNKTAKRDRYLTDAEFDAIRNHASPTLRVMMDICYLTGQRIGDVLAIRYADITDAGIYFKQKKTHNRVMVAMTPDVTNAIAAARALHDNVRGMTLFHTRGGKPFSYWTIRTLWGRATLAAGIADAHIHDMRAKAATDAKSQGLDSRTLLGHTTESSHARYLRSKEIPTAQPVKLRQSKTK